MNHNIESDDDYNDLFGDDDSNGQTKRMQDKVQNENHNDSDFDELFGSEDEEAGPQHDDSLKHPTKEEQTIDSDFEDMFASDNDDMFGSDQEESNVISKDHVYRSPSIPKRKRKRSSPGTMVNTTTNPHETNATIHPKISSNAGKKKFDSALKRPPIPLRPEQYPVFTVENYWSSLRRWNFLIDLNQSISRTNESNQSSEQDGPVIPDTFHCVEQYIATWAPLQLKETKAHIISDVCSSLSIGESSTRASCLPVTVTPPKQTPDHSHLDFLSLQITYRNIHKPQQATNHSFSALLGTEYAVNDLVLLVCDPSILEQALQGRLQIPVIHSSYSINSLLSLASPFVDNRLGIIGIVTTRGKMSDNGLTVSIAQQLWKNKRGSHELFLLRLGSNVTSFREYKALCNIAQTPMLKHLLAPTTLSSEFKTSHDHGINHLPIGFRIWAKSKFNTSQRTAISSVAHDFRGNGGFTLIKGPPGTGKTQTAVACLNALHLRQYQLFYSEIERITLSEPKNKENAILAISAAAKVKPRILVCAPSNAAVDNIIMKVNSERFLDGNGSKYSPSILRIGAGHSMDVADISISRNVDTIIEFGANVQRLEGAITSTRSKLKHISNEIWNVQERIRLLANASRYSLSRDWEIRIDEKNFALTKRVVFVNHRTHTVSFDCPPKPTKGEDLHPFSEMPHYRANLSTLVSLVEKQISLRSKLLQYILVQNASKSKAKNQLLAQELETNLLESAHIVLTTLGTVGSRSFDELVSKFTVCLIDEAAQATETAILTALMQLCGAYTVLIGDPQQLPATIFSMSGRNTKFDRSLFQRLEEAGHEVHLLDTQYRMHPDISAFPRHVFYQGQLNDSASVCKKDYGDSLGVPIRMKFPQFRHFNILDLESSEQSEGTSLSNTEEAKLVLYLYSSLFEATKGGIKNKIAIISPYMQQVLLIRRFFEQQYGLSYKKVVIISTIDSFQGKESDIVIMSSVRAATKQKGIGFLSDLRRLNVALTRAKSYLFVVARCDTVMQNPFWKMLVNHAMVTKSMLRVHPLPKTKDGTKYTFKSIVNR